MNTSTAGGVPNSVLFVPGDREDLADKALRSSPDAVVLDLEDAVAPAEKTGARRITSAQATALRLRSPSTQVFVRVNAPDTEWFASDVREAVPPGVGVVIPKCESRRHVEEVLDLSSKVEDARPHAIIAGIETARGLANVEEIAASRVIAVYFGAEDFIADMGGRRTGEGLEVLYARSRLVHAARAAGIEALDQVVVDVRDDMRFQEECSDALSLGFSGKLCIHPRQVELLHEVFLPTKEEIEWAREVLAARDKAEQERSGVAVARGRMIDRPLVLQAHAVLARAARRVEKAQQRDR